MQCKINTIFIAPLEIDAYYMLLEYCSSLSPRSMILYIICEHYSYHRFVRVVSIVAVVVSFRIIIIMVVKNIYYIDNNTYESTHTHTHTHTHTQTLNDLRVYYVL